MYAQVEKPKENKSKAVANSVVQKKGSLKQGFGFVDNRPEARYQQTIQRLTIGYTAADLGHPPAVALAFAAEPIMQFVYQRDAIPNATKVAVDGYHDCPAAGVYNHHVAHQVIYDKIRNRYEGQTRTNIVLGLGGVMTALGIPAGAQDPMTCVAAFNTWLDNAIVKICDCPANIFRGAQDGNEPNNPTAPTPALTARLAGVRPILDAI